MPWIPINKKGAKQHIYCLSASAQRRWPAISDFAKYVCVQWTDDELSHSSPAWIYCMVGMRHSSTSHTRRIPAILRSLTESLCKSINSITSGGKSTDHIIYQFWLSSPGRIYTPPAPYLHASEYPWQFGSFGTSWATLIGLFAMSLNSHLKSAKIAFRSGVSLIQPCLQLFIAALIAVKRPFPPGIPIDGCCKVPAIFESHLAEFSFSSRSCAALLGFFNLLFG